MMILSIAITNTAETIGFTFKKPEIGQNSIFLARLLPEQLEQLHMSIGIFFGAKLWPTGLISGCLEIEDKQQNHWQVVLEQMGELIVIKKNGVDYPLKGSIAVFWELVTDRPTSAKRIPVPEFAIVREKHGEMTVVEQQLMAQKTLRENYRTALNNRIEDQWRTFVGSVPIFAAIKKCAPTLFRLYGSHSQLIQNYRSDIKPPLVSDCSVGYLISVGEQVELIRQIEANIPNSETIAEIARLTHQRAQLKANILKYSGDNLSQKWSRIFRSYIAMQYNRSVARQFDNYREKIVANLLKIDQQKNGDIDDFISHSSTWLGRLSPARFDNKAKNNIEVDYQNAMQQQILPPMDEICRKKAALARRSHLEWQRFASKRNMTEVESLEDLFELFEHEQHSEQLRTKLMRLECHLEARLTGVKNLRRLIDRWVQVTGEDPLMSEGVKVGVSDVCQRAQDIVGLRESKEDSLRYLREHLDDLQQSLARSHFCQVSLEAIKKEWQEVIEKEKLPALKIGDPRLEPLLFETVAAGLEVDIGAEEGVLSSSAMIALFKPEDSSSLESENLQEMVAAVARSVNSSAINLILATSRRSAFAPEQFKTIGLIEVSSQSVNKRAGATTTSEKVEKTGYGQVDRPPNYVSQKTKELVELLNGRL